MYFERLLWVTDRSSPNLTCFGFAIALPSRRCPFEVFTKVKITSQFIRVWP